MAPICSVQMNELLRFLQRSSHRTLMEWLEAHLADGCESCHSRVAWLINLGESLATDGLSKVIIARSIPDPRLQSVPIALRGRLADVRQELFEARSDIRIDVQIEEIAPDSFTLEGQVKIFGGEGKTGAGANVSLHQDGERLAEATASVNGEFTFTEADSGTYDLTIVVDDACVVVPGLEI
mgnify:CR=1 FL=1